MSIVKGQFLFWIEPSILWLVTMLRWALAGTPGQMSFHTLHGRNVSFESVGVSMGCEQSRPGRT